MLRMIDDLPKRERFMNESSTHVGLLKLIL